MSDAPAYWAHESAIIDHGARIGDGTRVWHWTHVSAGAVIGKGCTLGQNVYVANKAIIGDGVRIQNHVSIFDGVTLEDDVFCGPNAVFTNVINPRSHVRRQSEYKPTLVRRGATLGANSTVICGRTINEYAFVGAGAVVTHDVQPYALVVGTPARRIGWMCACGERLPRGTGTKTCERCGVPYSIDAESCRPSR